MCKSYWAPKFSKRMALKQSCIEQNILLDTFPRRAASGIESHCFREATRSSSNALSPDRPVLAIARTPGGTISVARHGGEYHLVKHAKRSQNCRNGRPYRKFQNVFQGNTSAGWSTEAATATGVRCAGCFDFQKSKSHPDRWEVEIRSRSIMKRFKFPAR